MFSQWFDEIQNKWLAKWLHDVRQQLPEEYTFSDEYVKSEIVYQAIYMAGLFKGGYFPAYADMYVAKRAARVLLREWRRMELHVGLEDIEDPGEWDYDYDGVERHEYGEYEIEPYKSLSDHVDESDLVRQVQKIADENGLGKIAMMLKTMTEREIAEELCQSQPAVHRKIQKLRRLCGGLV